MIGEVRTVSGIATVIKTNGLRVNITPGTPVDQGDVIETGAGAAVGIVFIDKSVFSLGANARMTLDDLVYTGSGADRSAFSVLTGAFSFVSGEIGRTPEAMRVRTPVATIGVRGTQVAGNDELIVLLSQEGHVGSIILNGQVILDQENETFVRGSGSPSFLSPTQVNGLFSGILRLIPLIKGNLDNPDQNIAQLSEIMGQGSGSNPVGGGLQFQAFERDLVGFGLKITGPLQDILDALKGDKDEDDDKNFINHAPEANNETGAVSEAGAVNNGSPGTPKAIGTLADNVTDPDGDNLSFLPMIGGGTYGALAFNTRTGAWTYTLDNADSDTQALNAGETATEIFTYTVRDPFGAQATATLTVTITGADDNPTAAGTGGHVTEAGGLANAVPGLAAASGALSPFVSDVDNAGLLTDDLDFTVGAPGVYGALALNTETGAWTYTLNNSDTDTQALNQGETAVERFTYTVLDEAGATATATIAITMLGANDAPVAAAESGAGVTEQGSVVDGADTVTGTFADNVTDVDNAGARTDDLDFSFSGTGVYGALALNTESGAWTYTLNDADTDTDSLNDGETALETFTYTVVDEHGATASSTISLTILGANDAPAAADLVAAGGVTEAGGENNGGTGVATVSGTLADGVSDVDNAGLRTDDLDFTADAGAYGSLDLDTATGAWTYTLDDGGTDTQALNAGETALEIFTYTVSDDYGGTASATLTITVTGANDAPTASHALAGNVTEDVTLTTAGDADTVGGSLAGSVADVDAPGTTDDLEFSFSGGGTYGTLALGSDSGDWTYTIDNASTDTDALNAGETALDVFTYTVRDEHGATASATLAVTIVGANDAPVAHVVTAEVTEDGSDTVAGPFDATDADTGGAIDDPFTFSLATAVGAYGTLDFDSSTGDWTYTLNEAADGLNWLDAGETASETFDYTVTDHAGATAASQLTITIHGATDVPDFSNVSQDLDWFATAPHTSNYLGTSDPDLIIGSTDVDYFDALQGNDTIVLGAGDDDVTQGSAGDDLIFGGSGNDTLDGDSENDTLSGWSGDDSLIGDSENDALYGGPGSDTLDGGADADTLAGGTGADTLTGGTGADHFVIDSLDAADLIVDFSSGDKIDLVASLFPELSVGNLGAGAFESGPGLTAATQAGAHLVYDSTSGNLYYDADGNGGASSVHIATLNGAPALQNTDIQIIS